ncbi:MAG: DUF6880 family protein [Pyrinomonadaceae bacterium]
MPISALECLSVLNIRLLAGDRWFARGEAYLQQGRVNDLRADGRRLAANVTGTQTYRVRLSCRNSRIEFSCTCPVGEDGNFCKHCVAVALSWIDGESTLHEPNESAPKHNSDLRSFLETQDHQKLVDLILQEASKNRRLKDRLEFETARAQPTGPDVSVFRKAITSATRTTGIDYYSMPRFARRLSEVIDSIKSLLDDGHAKVVVELTEYAFTRLEKVIGRVDDSDGQFGYILPELEELHHSACLHALENPLILAKRLFEWELNSEWEFFSHAAANYADVLGSDGLREYQRLAEEHWSKVPILKPADDDGERYGFRFRITSIMETLAIEAGDLEALVAVKQRDLSHPYSFLQIAEIYQQAKHYDKALEWAEKGSCSFSRIDPRLSDLLAVEYHRRGRHAEAMTLIWQQFVESPGLQTYQKLRANAIKVKTSRDKLRLVDSSEHGVSATRLRKISQPSRQTMITQEVTDEDNAEWFYWRGNALRHLRERSETQKEADNRSSSSQTKTSKLSNEKDQVSNHWERQPNHSLLVEVFLWEKRYEEAWQEATSGGCAEHLWRQLLDAIGKTHPYRAFRIYQQLIAPTIAPTNNMAYSEAIKLLKKMHKLASNLHREREFDDYLIALRTQYKLKRNFIKLLDRMRERKDQ